MVRISRISYPFEQLSRKVRGRLLTCYSPVRHSSTQQKLSFSVRLACVKHAASVRPEPGSNSPNKNKNVKAQKNQPENPVSNPNQKHSKTKNRHKTKTNKHTIEFTNNTHTFKGTQKNLHNFRKVFRAKFPRSSFSLRSLPFGATRRTLRTCPPIVKSRLCAPPSTRTSAGFRGFRQDSAPYQAIFPRFSCARTQNVTQSVCHDALQTARRTPLTWRYSRTITFFAQNFTAR